MQSFGGRGFGQRGWSGRRMEPEADRFGKANGVGVVRFRAEGRVLFGGGQILDSYESLDEGIGKLLELLQNFGEDIRVDIRNRVGKTIFGEQVCKPVEELGEEVAVDMAEDGGVGEEFEF